jgi:hypothetical protein
MSDNTRKISSIVLIAVILMLAPVGEARADVVDTLFELLKQYHPDKDGVEFARYYYKNPKHGDVIYTKIAAQEYPFIAVLVAAKAAKNQKILPGGQAFGYAQCMTPITMFDAVFSKSGDYIQKYGQEEHIKGYMEAENEEAKQKASEKLAEYVPYWKEIPDICHFTFNSNFQDEKHLRETLAGSWKLIRGAGEDFGHGNVASGVTKLLKTGVTGETACMIADNAWGGVVGRVPVLGPLAKSACASFAGALIKGIGTVVGAVVNAVGEFVGDAACTAGIGSCTGNKSIDGIYNPNFQMMVMNYSFSPAADADAWATNWFAKVMGPKCHNQTGESGSKCADAFNQMVGSARAQASNLGAEASDAYYNIYEPAISEAAIMPLPIAKVLELDTLCIDNLRAKYPVPGPQLIDPKDDRRVYFRACSDARSSGAFSHGQSFDQKVQQRATAFQASIAKTDCPTGAGGKRVCRSYPGLQQCVNVYRSAGINEAVARDLYCSVDDALATKNVAWAVAMKATGCAAQPPIVVPGAKHVPYLTTCNTYSGYNICEQTVASTTGAPTDLVLGCRLNPIKARAAVTDAVRTGLGSAAADCRLEGNAFVCGSMEHLKQCKSLLAMQKDMPAGAVYCALKLQTGGTKLPTGGIVIPPPSGNTTPKVPIVLIPPGPSAQETAPTPTPEQVAGSLARFGCRQIRPGMFSCTTQRGVDVCDRYRAKGQARACRLAEPK